MIPNFVHHPHNPNNAFSQRLGIYFCYRVMYGLGSFGSMTAFQGCPKSALTMLGPLKIKRPKVKAEVTV